MFTGIVAATGRVERTDYSSGVLEIDIHCPEIAGAVAVGDSVAVSGVCVTATRTSGDSFSAQLIGETLQRTTLGQLQRGTVVNLELAARLADRMGGHLVQGHVDGVAEVIDVEEDGDNRTLWLESDPNTLRYLVTKGSVALDGVSLTVIGTHGNTFGVALIPHTLQATTLGDAKVGSRLNIEVDILAKYVERLLGKGS